MWSSFKFGRSEFAHSIYRSVPLATRVTPSVDTNFGDKTIISMVSAAEADLDVASQELGRRTLGRHGRVCVRIRRWSCT